MVGLLTIHEMLMSLMVENILLGVLLPSQNRNKGNNIYCF